MSESNVSVGALAIIYNSINLMPLRTFYPERPNLAKAVSSAEFFFVLPAGFGLRFARTSLYSVPCKPALQSWLSY